MPNETEASASKTPIPDSVPSVLSFKAASMILRNFFSLAEMVDLTRLTSLAAHIYWIFFCAICLAVPACLLLLVWSRNRKARIPSVIPVVAVFVLGLAMISELKSVLIGADYTRRLFVTIDVLRLQHAVFEFAIELHTIGDQNLREKA
jgi:hypothetical protein